MEKSLWAILLVSNVAERRKTLPKGSSQNVAFRQLSNSAPSRCGFVGRALFARSKLEERQIHSLSPVMSTL